MPIVYTRLNGGVEIIFSTTKDEAWKDVPDGAINAKEITVDEIPQEQEWRNAWVYDGQKINICLNTAKELALQQMQKEQELLKNELVRRIYITMIEEDTELYNKLKSQYQTIKDAHKPLEALQISGYNDPAVLERIKELSRLPKIEV